MRRQIIIIGRTHHDYQSGGEKYNYFINDYLVRKQDLNVKFDLLTEKHRSLQNSNILRILFLSFYYLYKYVPIKNYIIRVQDPSIQIDMTIIFHRMLGLYLFSLIHAAQLHFQNHFLYYWMNL